MLSLRRRGLAPGGDRFEAPTAHLSADLLRAIIVDTLISVSSAPQEIEMSAALAPFPFPLSALASGNRQYC
jgi:hypothetical protein